MPYRLSLAKYEAYDFEDEISNKLEKTDKKVDKNSKSLFSDDRVVINEKEIKQEDGGDLSDKNDRSENRSEHSEKYVKYNIQRQFIKICIANNKYLFISVFCCFIDPANQRIVTDKLTMTTF